jgi:hypoxanthine phosphoribosyltransferase
VRLSGADPGHIRHRDVLVVEDILDTGRTLHAVVGELEAMGANSIRVCALLDKPGRRIVPFEAQYRGFEIANEFVVGYGLDYNERYRELPAIHIFDPDA